LAAVSKVLESAVKVTSSFDFQGYKRDNQPTNLRLSASFRDPKNAPRFLSNNLLSAKF
jgi:hypothetical protein